MGEHAFKTNKLSNVHTIPRYKSIKFFEAPIKRAEVVEMLEQKDELFVLYIPELITGIFSFSTIQDASKHEKCAGIQLYSSLLPFLFFLNHIS